MLDMLLSKQCQSLNLPRTCTMRIFCSFSLVFIKRHQNLNANYFFIWTWFILQCFLKSIILYRLPMLKVLNVRVEIFRFTSISILSWGKHNLKLLNCFLYKQIIIRSKYVPMNMYVFFQMKIVTMLLVVAVFLDLIYTAVWLFFYTCHLMFNLIRPNSIWMSINIRKMYLPSETLKKKTTNG